MVKSLVIIQNPDVIIPVEAQSYLKNHSKYNIFWYTSDVINIAEIIQNHYQKGVRHFILSILSSEIQSISYLFPQLADAKFVATLSTLISLRGQFNNLYFTLPSDNYITSLIDIALPFNVVMVYDDIQNSYIQEVVQIFQTAGVPVFDVKDLTWNTHSLIGLIGLDNNLWTRVNDNLRPEVNYVIGALEIFPENDLILKPNIQGLYVYLPLSTTISQLNSYWNLLNANPGFTNMGTANNLTPLLTNVNWTRLINANLISNNLQHNGFNISLYKSSLDIHIKYNRLNHHVPRCASYIWLIDTQYINQYLLNNIKYLETNLCNLKDIVISTNIKADVCKYWNQGYREFILEAPSEVIKEVQQYKYKGAFFLCTRATDPKIRIPKSQYIFSLLDDDTMVDTSLNSINVGSLGKTVCIMGSSNNIDIPNFKTRLATKQIQYLNLTELDKIPPDTLTLVSVGNNGDFSVLVNYILKNRNRLTGLNSVYQYGLYSNQTQIDVLNNLGLTSYPLINYNSSQPFLDSYYSTISRPLYLLNLTNFLYLSNICFQFSPKLLFDFGYYIDI